MIPKNTLHVAHIITLLVLFLVGCRSGHDRITRYKSGGVKSQSSSTGGIDNVTGYFENGNKKSLTKYNGNQELSYDEWYEDGRKKIERRYSYRQEMINGHYQQLFEARVEKHWFHTDSLLYRRIGWYENGIKKEEHDFDYSGRLNGFHTTWNKNGDVIKRQRYRHGAPVDDSAEERNSEFLHDIALRESLPEYEYRWKIRGKTAVALLYDFKPVEKTFLTSGEGRIDTIFYQKMLATDTSEWSYYLTRISIPGYYEGFTGPCCGRFHVVPPPKTETTQNNVIFRMTSSDGKLYLARLGDNGVILRAGVDAHLERACDLFMVSGNEAVYREIAIEEIDTSDSCISQHIVNEDDDGVTGESGTTFTDSIEVKSLACVNSVDAESIGMFSYCAKRTVTAFQFIWLDNAPLIVEFDPVRQMVVLH